MAYKKQDCSNPDCCVDEPSTYIRWHEWARKKAKTHIQKRCFVCKLYTVWELKKSA